ncbi:hypothetical protein TruAng_000349 [Truncatella angustata]|nr:hypothetical protein TruAng_000349 [Truncatella angustata]
MSPAPSFNYYEELEVSPTATQQDVVFSYRKLAKVHHPDRNHGDASTATAKFQGLGEAYETLSKPDKRAQYDQVITASTFYSASNSDSGAAAEGFHSSHGRFPFSSGFPFGGFDGGHFGYSPFDSPLFQEDGEGKDDDGGYHYEIFCVSIGPGRYVKMKRRVGQDARREVKKMSPEEEVAAKARRHTEAREDEVKEARRKKARERQQRVAEKVARQQANATIKAQQQKREEQQFEADRKAQEARWKQENTTTAQQMQATCLHANLWTKVKQAEKLKCVSCNTKRGVFAFKCPLCGLLVCQHCQNQFMEKKKKKKKTERL